MKKIKLVLFLIISLITTGLMDSEVLAVSTINPTTPDEKVTQVTKCVYTATEGNENFTVTYSVQPNNKGGATINWVESSHSKIKLYNSFVYAKEFITSGDTITCPTYLNYEVNSSAGTKYMKISFRTTYSKQLQLSTEKTRNNNKKFTKNSISQISTCSYDNGFGGRLYVDAYTDGTVKTYLSTQDHSEFNFEVVAFDTLNASIFSSSSCPKLGVGYDQTEENGKIKYTVYVSPGGVYDEETFNTKQQTGTLLKKTGDNINNSQSKKDCCVYKSGSGNLVYLFNSNYIGENGSAVYYCLGSDCIGTKGNLSTVIADNNLYKDYGNVSTNCATMPTDLWISTHYNLFSGTYYKFWNSNPDPYGQAINNMADYQSAAQYTLSTSSTCPATLIDDGGEEGDIGGGNSEIGDGEIDWGDQADVNCDGIIGEELLGFINKIFNWIRIIAPIFVIIMGSVEFAGAVLQDDKDAMKKASSKFIKRLIIAVALFFIPTILEFLLNIFNEFSSHSAEICGIGE